MTTINLRPAGYFGPGSSEISPPASSNEGGVRRLHNTQDRLITEPAPGVSTLPELIAHASKTHGTSHAMGWRDIIKVHEEEKETKRMVEGKERTEKKTWKYFELGGYNYLDYVQLEEAIGEVARGLVECGVKKDEVVDLFAETSPNWQIMSHACASISTTTATAYDTLGEEGLKHSLNEPECVGIFTNPALLSMLAKVLPHTPSVRFVFYDGTSDDAVLDKIRSIRKDDQIRTMHIDELRSLGRSMSSDAIKDRKPSVDSLACIMYTSGSTGAPKGVRLTHGNLLSAVGAMHTVFGPHIPQGARYIAYLPLAHVLEYVVELCALFAGVTLGYARPKTLTDQSVRGCKGDLREFKPNIMFGVPAVWESVRKGILGQVEKSGMVMKSVFNTAVGVKRWAGGWVPGLNWAVDTLVLARVRDAVGGELQFAVNGGAAIGKETQAWFNLVVGPLTQGYGLTESCGMCAFLAPELLSIGPVGIPAPSVEIKLLDCPDMGYFSSTSSSNDKNASASENLPQGEICIRGPSVTKGYFKRDDLNKDESVFTKDGWFRTGDIGQWNADGTLSLVDRMKNLVKLQSGEYIALERLESIFKSSDLVSNICIYATSDMQQPIAIVYPHESNLAKASGTSTSLKEMCGSDSARALVLKSLQDLGKQNGLARMELPAGVVLTPEEWTAENGMVSAAGKVNRKKVREGGAGAGDEVEKLVEKQKK